MKIITTRGNEDRKNSSGFWIRSWTDKLESGVFVQHHTLSGSRWGEIGKRVKVGGRFQSKKPSYVGVENLFGDFQEFVEWSKGQVGYDLKEDNGMFWAIDKDILNANSKSYSPENCLFVPSRVNSFMVSCSASRGDLPIGVVRSPTAGKFIAACRGLSENLYLGTFDDPISAHRAWQTKKVEIGYKLIVPYKVTHTLLYDAFCKQLESIQYEYDNKIETIR